MSELFIHIGLHKTGSSSLQNWLSINQKNLGIIYPTFFESSNHSWPLSIIFGNNPHAHNSNGLMGYTSTNIDGFYIEIISRLSEDIKLSIESGRDLVISGEELSTFDCNEVQKLCNFFKNYYSRFKVIIYLRGIRDLLNSTIQQLIKDGLLDFNHVASSTQLSIISRIKPWIDIFGMENIIVRNNTGGNFDITSDFSSIIQLPEIERNNNFPIRVNKGIPLEGLAVIFRAWKFFKFSGFPLSYQHTSMVEIVDFCSKHFVTGAKFQFSKDILNKYVDSFFMTEIEWINLNFSIDINDIEYQDSNSPIQSEIDMINIKVGNRFLNDQDFQKLSVEAQSILEAILPMDNKLFPNSTQESNYALSKKI